MIVSILGAGNMGTALSHVLAGQGHHVSAWDHFTQVVTDIRQRHENPRFLPGVSLHPSIRACDTALECVTGSGLIIICVPSPFVAAILEPLLQSIEPNAILLNVAKGFAPGTFETMSAFLQQLAPTHPCVHLAGPTIATEFARGSVTPIVLASNSLEAARIVSDTFAGKTFLPSATTDLTGASLCGILKNIYAILLGCLEKIGDHSRNLEAAVLTACMNEMAAIAIAHGAEHKTIFGLSGLGDLIATATSPDSHNRKVRPVARFPKNQGQSRLAPRRRPRLRDHPRDGHGKRHPRSAGHVDRKNHQRTSPHPRKLHQLPALQELILKLPPHKDRRLA